jgi:hypothetical protein
MSEVHSSSDELRQRLLSMPTVVAPAELRELHNKVGDLAVAVGRLDAKLDAVIELRRKVEAVDAVATDHETRLVKLESFQGLILWIINGGWVVLTGTAFILAKLGVI